MSNARWRRLTEERAGGAKSVLHFDVRGSVAKSTHAGIPWLRFIRQRIGARAHFWPFDGWDIPAGSSAIVEVYPTLWSRDFASEGRTGDQRDASSIVASLSRAEWDGRLGALFKPDLTPTERSLAQVEGWILGVMSNSARNPGPSAAIGGGGAKMRETATPTTKLGYLNKNEQKVVRKTHERGTDHNQWVYVLACGKCGQQYGANGSDIWLRRCPACQGGAPSLSY